MELSATEEVSHTWPCWKLTSSPLIVRLYEPGVTFSIQIVNLLKVKEGDEFLQLKIWYR